MTVERSLCEEAQPPAPRKAGLREGEAQALLRTRPQPSRPPGMLQNPGQEAWEVRGVDLGRTHLQGSQPSPPRCPAREASAPPPPLVSRHCFWGCSEEGVGIREQVTWQLTQVEGQLRVPQVAPHKVPQGPHWRRKDG